jgi:hypothetical protein
MDYYRKWYTADMIIVLHILIALASVAVVSWAYIRPTAVNLRVTYGLTALTIASGTYLVVAMPAHMIQACTSGLLYLAVMSLGIVFARIKLVRLQNEI